MKKRVLILVMLLVVSFLTKASNDKEVIKSIKGNYYSIKENWDDLYKYKSTSNGSDILVYSEIESFTTENHYCVVIKEQKIIYEYYIKGEKLYFVFTNNNGLENRYYFNSNDEIIRWLDADKLEIVNGLDVKSEELFSKLFLVKSKSDIIDKFINSVNSRYYNPTTINRDSAISENEGVFKLIYENKNIGFLMLFALLILVLFIKKRSSKENVIEDELNASNTTKNKGVNEAEKINKVYSDGSKYVGEWKDGKRHGIGVFTKSTKHNNLAPGELFVISIYDGEWKDDCRFGEGLFTEEYMAGDNHHSYLERYTGKWNLDKYHGKGKLTDSKGNIYDGYWELGVKDGGGVMTYTNGNTYDGEWKDDKKHGQGTMTWKNAQEQYKGEYKDDIIHGHGAYTYANGNTYEGEMKDGEMHGQGKYSVDGYGVFVGDFVKGGIAGKGVFNYTNGEKYDGEWKDAKRHGKGVYTFSDGFEYDGLWDVGFFIDGEKRIDITDSEYKRSKQNIDIEFKEILEINGFTLETFPNDRFPIIVMDEDMRKIVWGEGGIDFEELIDDGDIPREARAENGILYFSDGMCVNESFDTPLLITTAGLVTLDPTIEDGIEYLFIPFSDFKNVAIYTLQGAGQPILRFEGGAQEIGLSSQMLFETSIVPETEIVCLYNLLNVFLSSMKDGGSSFEIDLKKCIFLSANKNGYNEKNQSHYLENYPGELYCENYRWDSEEFKSLKLLNQPFLNVFQDGEYQYNDLFRRFTYEEVDLIVNKIKSTGTLIYLQFVRDILSKKFDMSILHSPFWFDPYIISAALDGCGGLFYFERNGFHVNTYKGGGRIVPSELANVTHVDTIHSMNVEKGYNKYYLDLQGDENILTTISLKLVHPVSGNSVALDFIQTNGSKYASTLPIVEAIWEYSWKQVVQGSKAKGMTSFDLMLNFKTKSFDSWDELLNWAKA
ncbi:MAG: hypothetical protein H8E16_09685 [Flavobacteriales bacterium]|nr:hypothetical protein [Flavobacteriales bacterium]